MHVMINFRVKVSGTKGFVESPRATSSPSFLFHSWTSVSRLRILNLRFYGNRGEEGMFIMEQVCKHPLSTV